MAMQVLRRSRGRAALLRDRMGIRRPVGSLAGPGRRDAAFLQHDGADDKAQKGSPASGKVPAFFCSVESRLWYTLCRPNGAKSLCLQFELL